MFQKALQVVSKSIWDDVETSTWSPRDDTWDNDVLGDGDYAPEERQTSWNSDSWESSTKSWMDDWYKSTTESSRKWLDDMTQQLTDHSTDSSDETALSDFPEEDPSDTTITIRIFEYLTMQGADKMAMWRCAGVALGLVLATLAVMALLYLTCRWCCTPKPHVATCVANGELERGSEYLPPVGWVDKHGYPSPGGWSDQQAGVQLIEPRLLDLYTKPSPGEVDPRHLDTI